MARRRRGAAAAPAASDAVAAPQAATKTRRGGGLNLENAVRYLQFVSIRQLDGVYFALNARLEELGVAVDRKAHAAYDTSGAANPTGNIRGILTFVANATADDAAALQCLQAVVAARFKLAGYKPKEDTALT